MTSTTAPNHMLYSNGHSVFSGARLSELPDLDDVPPSERMRLFRQKLKLCGVVYDFTDPRKHVREKEAKRNALLQIVEFISSGKAVWDHKLVMELLDCIAANIFRLLGRQTPQKVINEEGKAEGLFSFML